MPTEGTNKLEIVFYQPDETILMEDDTIWLTQAQLAQLFGTKRQATSKHIKICNRRVRHITSEPASKI